MRFTITTKRLPAAAAPAVRPPRTRAGGEVNESITCSPLREAVRSGPSEAQEWWRRLESLCPEMAERTGDTRLICGDLPEDEYYSVRMTAGRGWFYLPGMAADGVPYVIATALTDGHPHVPVVDALTIRIQLAVYVGSSDGLRGVLRDAEGIRCTIRRVEQVLEMTTGEAEGLGLIDAIFSGQIGSHEVHATSATAAARGCVADVRDLYDVERYRRSLSALAYESALVEKGVDVGGLAPEPGE